MAKVTFSPLIAGMRGATADAVFSVWRGIPYVRSRVIPHNPQSAGQTLVRNSLAEAVAIWQWLSTELTVAYEAGAEELGISGYNDFVGRNRAHIQAETGLFGPRRNLDAAGDRIAIPIDYAFTSEAAPGQQNWGWTDPGQGADYRFGALVYDATDNTILKQVLNLDAMASEQYAFDGCTIGHSYLNTVWVYRVSDGELVHFGSGARTQVT